MIIDGCYCHARARPIDSRPPARGSSPPSVSLLRPFPSLEEKLSPFLAATTGRAVAQPFAGDECILQVCRARPFSFLVLCETEHPKP